MKQSLYEKIKFIVESGNIAITQNEETKRFNLWSSLYGEWIRVSGSFDSINECYNHLGEHYLTEGETDIAQEGGERYIGIYERPLWRPKVGDIVQVLQSIRDCPDRDSERDAMIYLSLKVKKVGFAYCVLEYGNIGYLVPYDCIAPRVEVG